MTRTRRFLLVTWDGAGNVAPELALARELVRRGHDVDVLSHDSVRQRIESSGSRFIPLRAVHQWDTTKEQPEDETAFYLENCFFARGYAADTTAAVSSGAYDVLLVDGLLAFAIAAALSSRLPTVVLVPTLYALYESGPFAAALDSELARFGGDLERFGLGPFPRFKDLVEAAHEVLVFSFADFDKTTAKVTHVGPLRAAAGPPDWPRRFEGRPFVVVGLSTANQSQGPVLQRICDALAELDVEAVITTGPAIEPASLAAPENVTLARYVPHERLLRGADLLMTHGGHGTVIAGAQQGVPTICMPVGADQPCVAARVAELGLGIIVMQDSSTEEIRRTIERALADQAMRQTCQSFAATVKGQPGIDRALRACLREFPISFRPE